MLPVVARGGQWVRHLGSLAALVLGVVLLAACGQGPATSSPSAVSPAPSPTATSQDTATLQGTVRAGSGLAKSAPEAASAPVTEATVLIYTLDRTSDAPIATATTDAQGHWAATVPVGPEGQGRFAVFAIAHGDEASSRVARQEDVVVSQAGATVLVPELRTAQDPVAPAVSTILDDATGQPVAPDPDPVFEPNPVTAGSRLSIVFSKPVIPDALQQGALELYAANAQWQAERLYASSAWPHNIVTFKGNLKTFFYAPDPPLAPGSRYILKVRTQGGRRLLDDHAHNPIADHGDGDRVTALARIVTVDPLDGLDPASRPPGTNQTSTRLLSTAANAAWIGTRGLDPAISDIAYSVAVDQRTGNIYVAGDAYGSFDGNTYAGLIDIILIKYSPSGVKQWTRQVGTVGIDIGQGVAVDPNGNIYVTGDTGWVLDGDTYRGSNDIVLLKYDPSGNRLWTRQVGTKDSDQVYAVAVDSINGNIYVAGLTTGGLDGNANAGRSDIILTKYSPPGVKQWTRQVGTEAWDMAYGVAVDPNGNIYVTGWTAGNLDDNTNAGYADLFLIKYTPSGMKQWTRQLGSARTDVPKAVAVDSSGNIYVAGHTDGDLDGNIPDIGFHWDIFLIKHDPSGNKQ